MFHVCYSFGSKKIVLQADYVQSNGNEMIKTDN